MAELSFRYCITASDQVLLALVPGTWKVCIHASGVISELERVHEDGVGKHRKNVLNTLQTCKAVHALLDHRHIQLTSTSHACVIIVL